MINKYNISMNAKWIVQISVFLVNQQRAFTSPIKAFCKNVMPIRDFFVIISLHPFSFSAFKGDFVVRCNLHLLQSYTKKQVLI